MARQVDWAAEERKLQSVYGELRMVPKLCEVDEGLCDCLRLSAGARRSE